MLILISKSSTAMVDMVQHKWDTMVDIGIHERDTVIGSGYVVPQLQWLPKICCPSALYIAARLLIVYNV